MLYPFSHVQHSVLFTFSLHVNAEEKKKQSLGGFSRASSQGIFQFLFHSQIGEWLCHFLPSRCCLGAIAPVWGLCLVLISVLGVFQCERPLPGTSQYGGPVGWGTLGCWALSDIRVASVGTSMGQQGKSL